MVIVVFHSFNYANNQKFIYFFPKERNFNQLSDYPIKTHQFKLYVSGLLEE
jgi:hypothetical protein